MPLRIRSARRKLVFMMVALALLGVWLSGCKTIQGFGEDISSASKDTEDLINGN